jgi:biopolymer transport protein ExbD
MAFKKAKKKLMIDLNLVPMIDITSFILLALAILAMSMKKEASLDNILNLPPILYSSKQDTTDLQIYILPAKVLEGGVIQSDSTGLVAFTGKGKPPAKCPSCGAAFRNEKMEYIPGTLLDMGGAPVQFLTKAVEEETAESQSKLLKEIPPAYFCASCRYEISPYLKLDEIPQALKAKKKEVVDLIVAVENSARDNIQKPHLTEEEVKKIDESIPLMIKADDKAFYGRILEVVNMAKDTLCAIKKFAFVTEASASMDAQKKDKIEEMVKARDKK